MKILIPLDGSTNANKALDYVLANVHNYKQIPQLLLLNVQWKVDAGNVKLFINQDTINDYYREQGMADLAYARAALDAAKLPYQYHISIGNPAEAILQYAQEQAVDMLVMGKQGQGGLRSLLVGSVANKVVHAASLPVLLVS